jgi:hypothetical protein
MLSSVFKEECYLPLRAEVRSTFLESTAGVSDLEVYSFYETLLEREMDGVYFRESKRNLDLIRECLDQALRVADEHCRQKVATLTKPTGNQVLRELFGTFRQEAGDLFDSTAGKLRADSQYSLYLNKVCL